MAVSLSHEARCERSQRDLSSSVGESPIERNSKSPYTKIRARNADCNTETQTLVFREVRSKAV